MKIKWNFIREVFREIDIIKFFHKFRFIFDIQFHSETREKSLNSIYFFDIYFDNVQNYKKNQTIFQLIKNNRLSSLLIDILSKERVDVASTFRMANVANIAKTTIATTTAA